MERLTEWRGEHAAVVNHHENYIDRLAAYEDTGMTPEDIRSARETLRCFDNIGIKRGNEIVTAEEEGRLVVLEKNDDPMSLDSLSLFLRNRADAVGELNEYDKMLMREASDRLAEAALKGGEG